MRSTGCCCSPSALLDKRRRLKRERKVKVKVEGRLNQELKNFLDSVRCSIR